MKRNKDKYLWTHVLNGVVGISALSVALQKFQHGDVNGGAAYLSAGVVLLGLFVYRCTRPY